MCSLQVYKNLYFNKNAFCYLGLFNLTSKFSICNPDLLYFSKYCDEWTIYFWYVECIYILSISIYEAQFTFILDILYSIFIIYITPLSFLFTISFSMPLLPLHCHVHFFIVIHNIAWWSMVTQLIISHFSPMNVKRRE